MTEIEIREKNRRPIGPPMSREEAASYRQSLIDRGLLRPAPDYVAQLEYGRRYTSAALDDVDRVEPMRVTDYTAPMRRPQRGPR